MSKQVLVYSAAVLTFTAVSQLGLHSHWLRMDSTGLRWRTQVSGQTPVPSPTAKLQTGVMRTLPQGKGCGEHKAGDDHSIVPNISESRSEQEDGYCSGLRVWLT